MAVFTIDLPDRLLPSTQAVVARNNADNGSDLTIEGWLKRHVTEAALPGRIPRRARRLAKQAQEDLEAALRALREVRVGS
jgi:hypothetical protein